METIMIHTQSPDDKLAPNADALITQLLASSDECA